MSAPEDNYAAPNAPYFTPIQDPPAGTAVVPQPSGKDVPTLFQPLTIRGVTFQNRIFLSPLCQYSAKDGFVSPWHMAHLGGIFTRGPGLSVIEATAVQPNGRITPWDVGIWSDEHIAGLKQITDFAHSQNQKIAIQLAHAGRKSSCMQPWAKSVIAYEEVGGWPNNVVGPSPIPFNETYPQPKELTEEGIKQMVKDWASAAERAVKAGFDVIEIHNAHGYLLSSFVSPASNKRTDNYGGSFENRVRLTLEIIDAVRAVIPETMPVFLRITATDWLEEVAPEEPSWTSEDTVKLAGLIAERGVDLLDVSSGGNDPRQKITNPGPGYQVRFASAAKKAHGSKILVGCVGRLANGVDAQKVLDNGDSDVIFVGRMFQKNPGQVWAMADDLDVDILAARQMHWGFKGRGSKAFGGKDGEVLKKTN
ncbi:NADH:flavin oxidoreductase/NADH oxidase [Ephemerocybe angulata]|uniref:NADH:flavin oxidoreductase/NADH oxidase n=1 Tax=Ephemerocybe angulata TaxID=980116 RepID=A0A8H6IFY9_9AGAR|nr:NADH:flavin oxidoreductase/NADH oxidase [Tulosesus angulatus]